MEQIYEMNEPTETVEKKGRIHHSRKQTFIHYAVAVAMTMILMSTGVFSQLLKMSDTVEDKESRHTESFVESFLDQRGSIINKFELGAQFKEGKQNE
ncbi:hypothetical protein ACA29_15915 [Lederbergia galactosidilytica]|uniref:Uncharacterized protein n=2 Tax=Lederbergia galactosidilytica TaxID=217031 RepID=A0A0Q9Y212_9BACI|nr:hypothetical protein ACA29_15915 [Lederbergia galactosidilytica]